MKHSVASLVLFIALLLFVSACGDKAGSEQVDVVVPAGVETGSELEAETPTEPATPQATETAAPAVAGAIAYDLLDSPVLLRDVVEEWPANRLTPGAIIYHDGVYHMFFNASDHWPSTISVGYATSPDGLTWTLASESPVLIAEGIPYTDFTLHVGGGLVMEDGTWVLYFNTIQESLSNLPQTIGRATAPNPAGPWTADPEPVLAPGGFGTWDGFSVRLGSVLPIADGYVMYYAGSDAQQSAKGAIGMASSADGITWKKYDDSATTEDLYVESDPVYDLNPAREFTGAFIWDPVVQEMPAGYLMAHLSYEVVDGQWVIRHAFSADGITWSELEDEARLSTHRDDWEVLFDLALVYGSETSRLYFSPRVGFVNESDIYLATSPGPVEATGN